MACRTSTRRRVRQIRACVGCLRALAGTDPDAPDLVGLVDELLAERPEFVRLWERYEVRAHTHASKTFHLPDVGTLTRDHDKMVLLDMVATGSDTKPAEKKRN